MFKRIGFATSFIHLALGCTALFAQEADLHFWPTAIRIPDPQAHGALFMWPEYRVLLQTKNGSAYEQASVDDAMAEWLNRFFEPAAGSPITIARDASASTWGICIPGGEQLREQNQELLPMMVEKFSSCLGTLNDADLALMKEVLYAPASFLGSDGVNLDDEKMRAAHLMLTNFQANRCEDPTTQVPELLRQKSEHYLKALLTAKSESITEPSGALLVITTLFHDLLFSAKGLWVRTTLAKLQDFIGARLATIPALTDKSFLDRDYESFLDFVLLARNASGLSLEQYLSIARILDIDGIADIFKPFPLKQHIAEGRINVVNLNLGSRLSTVFFEGAKQ